MKFLVVAALVAAVAAHSAYPTYPKAYPTPAYPVPAYPAPAAYPVPAYKLNDYAPEPYSFNYEVKDDYYNNFGHQETSDGKYVTGSYHVALPDGRHQTVTYKADDYGYVAGVKYDGYAKEYVYKSSDYKPTATYPKPSYPENY